MKIRLSVVFLFLASSLFLIISCSKSSEDKLSGNGGSTCDTVNMKYATDVVPILQANCYSCHGNGSTTGGRGISLDGYTNLKKYADNGSLAGNITHAAGYVAMPYQLPKLADCNINIILDWINRGSQNN